MVTIKKRLSSLQIQGIVVELKNNDFNEFYKHNVFAGLEFQKKIEKNAWEMAGKTQKVPAQRLVDFINGKTSIDIPKTSYLPGTVSSNLRFISKIYL